MDSICICIEVFDRITRKVVLTCYLMALHDHIVHCTVGIELNAHMGCPV
jgi:hypothetical protein